MKIPFIANRRRRASNSRDAPKEPISLWGALQWSRAQTSLRGSEAIYAAVSRIANTIACMPLHLYHQYDIAADDAREMLVSRAPNMYLTPFGMKMAAEACRGTVGSAYILIVPEADGVTPQRLDVLDPGHVETLRDTLTREVWYRVTLDDGVTALIHSMYMIALHHMTTDGVTGISPIEVLGATLKYDRDVKEIAVEQLKSIRDSVVLSMPTQLNKDRKEEIINQFLDAYKKSSGQLIVLDGGVTQSTIKASAVDPKVLDVDRITVGKVARVYNMPPRMLGDASASGYSTSEQDVMEFITTTALPIVTQWEEAFNRKLLTQDEYADGYRFRFTMDELSRGDTTTMANKYQKAIRGGWMTPNEVRANEYAKPFSYGDQLMMARDTIPLRIAVEHPEMLLGGVTGKGGNDDEENMTGGGDK